MAVVPRPRSRAAAADHSGTAVVVTRYYDPVLVFTAGALMTLGVAMVYSATVTIEGSGLSTDVQAWWHSPLRQGIFALAGFLGMLVAAHVDYRLLAWERPRGGWLAGILAAVAAALLVAVLVPGIGKEALGARRAIEVPGLGGLSFQPSEIAKVVLVVWVAALLTRPLPPAGGRSWRLVQPPARRQPPLGNAGDLVRGFLPAALSGAVLIGLTGIEDFGTAALMGAILLALLLAGGARVWYLVAAILPGLAVGAVLLTLKPARLARLTNFFGAEVDPSGAGYQISQALMSIGSGGWFGRGLGNGVQKYGYLPQDNNDFILASICEELGVAGGLAVTALFLVILWRGWKISRAAPDAFGRLLALGLTLTICLQAAFNIGVVTHSVPTKGISLPFVSAGGSGVVFLGLAAGLLASIGRRYARVG